MKITVDLTKQEIIDILSGINFYFEECECPARTCWPFDSNWYSEKEKEYIIENPTEIALLRLGNQLEEILKED